MINDPASYRDPSGHVFTHESITYRQVNQSFKNDLEKFLSSGCYDELVASQLIVPFEKINNNFTGDENWYTTLRPTRIPFISYSWEWSFQMLKDAAILTLQIQEKAIKHGLCLKDANTFNVQFHEGKPIFIDSLSFEIYKEEKPWVAYRQFCEQFLAPLAIMHYKKISLHALNLAYPQGIPLPIAAAMLPWRSKFSLHCFLHLHLNAKLNNRRAREKDKQVRFTRKRMQHLIQSLLLLTQSLHLKEIQTNWSDYYAEASLRNEYLEEKKRIIKEWIKWIAPEIKDASDLGANDGEFSRLFAEEGINCLSADLDPNCIDRLYIKIKKENIRSIQPIIQDLSLPSPPLGWNNEEHRSFIGRAERDAVLALALIHHLVIGKNIPMNKAAHFFSKLCKKWLIIEFVHADDEKVVFMADGKPELIEKYSIEAFEHFFLLHFRIENKYLLADKKRTLYLLKKK